MLLGSLSNATDTAIRFDSHLNELLHGLRMLKNLDQILQVRLWNPC